MTENVKIVEVSKIDSLKNPELKNAAKQIVKLEKTRDRAAYAIAQVLKTVDDKRLFVEDGYKNIEQFANAMFGYKRVTVSNMLRIAKTYMLPDGSTILKNGENDFTYTKLSELLSLGPDTLKKAVQNGDITPDMMQKELRNYVKKQKAAAIPEEHATNDNDTENASNAQTAKAANATESADSKNAVKIYKIAVRIGFGEYEERREWNVLEPIEKYLKECIFRNADEKIKTICKATDTKYYIETDEYIYGLQMS
jgi:hypothetical protein